MNGHLSSDSISKWLAGERAADDERHAKECAVCAAKLAHAEGLFGAFGESVRGWSGHVGQGFRPAAFSGGVPSGKAAAARKGRPTRLALAAAALLIAVAVPVWKDSHDRRHAAEQAKADVLLWQQVDEHITRPVPASLAPLLDLVAWEPPPVKQIRKGENR